MKALRWFSRCFAVASIAVLTGCVLTDEGGGTGPRSQTLSRVRDRGYLICGTDGKLPGFSYVKENGSYAGFDVDLCRAIAAAVLGTDANIQFRDTTATDRFTVVKSGEVDVLARTSTLTLSRDAAGGNGLSYSPTIFYGGQALMVPRGSGITSLKDLRGKAVCVTTGTTTELNLADAMRTAGVEYRPLKFQIDGQTYSAYAQGRCAAITSDRSLLAARRTSLEKPSDHVILPLVLSKEPVGVISRNQDPVWADVVRWTMFALIQAEEWGVTQENIEAKITNAEGASGNPEMARFFGITGDLGAYLGLDPGFAVSAIRATGNYGEIFERNLGKKTPIKVDRGLNNLWTNGGLLYSPPFR